MVRASVAALVALGFCATSQAHDYVQMSGQDLYVRFCAACHGDRGRGDGPVSASLSVETPDLTTITRRTRAGVEARERIMRAIDGRHIIGAHGSRTMPVWGEDFSRLDLGNPAAEQGTRKLIERLADYVLTLQVPATP
jgi:mono/diheme cytochrome c family protein